MVKFGLDQKIVHGIHVQSLADAYNQIADILCGYREASEKEVVKRALYLVELEKKFYLNDQNEILINKIKELQDIVEDIEAGAYRESK